jgi:hypothetical protein
MNNDWMPVSMRLGNKPLFELSDWIPDEVKSSVVSIIRRIINENNINLNIFIARLHVPNILNYSIEERFFGISMNLRRILLIVLILSYLIPILIMKNVGD